MSFFPNRPLWATKSLAYCFCPCPCSSSSSTENEDALQRSPECAHVGKHGRLGEEHGMLQLNANFGGDSQPPRAAHREQASAKNKVEVKDHRRLVQGEAPIQPQPLSALSLYICKALATNKLQEIGDMCKTKKSILLCFAYFGSIFADLADFSPIVCISVFFSILYMAEAFATLAQKREFWSPLKVLSIANLRPGTPPP